MIFLNSQRTFHLIGQNIYTVLKGPLRASSLQSVFLGPYQAKIQTWKLALPHQAVLVMLCDIFIEVYNPCSLSKPWIQGLERDQG
jgi:hypothetical protein